MKNRIPVGQIVRVAKRIPLIRGNKIIIDADLAEFYGVSIKRLREQIQRNKKRFPDDFLFRLTHKEKRQVADACPHLDKMRHSRTLPYAFTEHGAIMAATVLNSGQAVEMSIFVVRAFVKLREAVSSHKELAQKMAALERKIAQHDIQIVSLVKAIKQLISPTPVPKKRQIGFKSKDKD